jgi:hypothetical protein
LVFVRVCEFAGIDVINKWVGDSLRTVFISHSAKTTAEEKYLEIFAAGLTAEGFEVWLDRHCLKGGDDWNQKIGNHLVYCQGAVALLTKQSLQSHFVQHEISNLIIRWRRERHPSSGDAGFPFCPIVLADDVLPELAKGFAASIRLNDVQYVPPCSPQLALSAVLPAFRALPDRHGLQSPLRLIESKISGILRAVSSDLLEAAAQEARLQVDPAHGVEALALDLARQILIRPLVESWRFLVELRPVISREQQADIFELIAPAWVSAEAAREFGHAVERKMSEACVINGERPRFTADMYLRRARKALPRAAGTIIEVATITHCHALDQLQRSVREALAVTFGLDFDGVEREFDMLLQREIREHREDTGRPIIVVLPLAESDLDLLASLRTEPVFHGITFVAMSPYVQDSSLVPGVIWLRPELRPHQEESAFRQHHRLLASLP